METITEKDMKKILKQRKVLYGYNQAKKALKSGKSENIIVAGLGMAKGKFKSCLEYEGDSKKMGIICGKPFNISTITILKEE